MQSLVLEYHDVYDGLDPDASGFPGSGPASYKLSTTDFRLHLDAMRSRGLSASLAPGWLEAGGEGRPLFLTFDDGGAGAGGAAADVLESCGWRGHFFLTAGRIGTRGFLDATTIRELRGRGHVIGTHSFSHPTMMGALKRDEILSEWIQSRAVIEDLLGEPVGSGSVPGGYYTRSVGEAASEAGLGILFTSMPKTTVLSVGPCRIFGRYTIRRWTSPLSAARIASGALGPRLSQWAIYTTLNTLRSLAGTRYTKLRQWYWSTRKPHRTES
jgi:peptidoglycan/xylan/chitin deacetylase (PgdA/CDA1 family)